MGLLTVRCPSLREPAAGELIRHHGRIDVVELRNRCGNTVSRAIVKQTMPTSGETASREQNGQLGLLIGYRLGRKLKDGPAEPPVFAFHDVQR